MSFSGAEVAAIDAIFTTLCRGGDPKLLLRSDPARNVIQKFSSLRRKIEAAELNGTAISAGVISIDDPNVA